MRGDVSSSISADDGSSSCSLDSAGIDTPSSATRALEGHSESYSAASEVEDGEYCSDDSEYMEESVSYSAGVVEDASAASCE